MFEEARVLRGQNRVPQIVRDVVVMNDDAPLDGELADQLAILAEHAGDRVGRVIVEGADFGQIIRIREQHAAQRAEQRRGDKQCSDTGVTSVANGFHIRKAT